MNIGSPKGFLDPKMDLFSGYFWVFLSKIMQILFWIFTRIFMRYCSPEAINSACSSSLTHENYQTGPKSDIFGEGTTDTLPRECDEIDSSCYEAETWSKNDTRNLGLEEEETTKLVFKFQYQTGNCSEEFKGSYGRSNDFVNTDTASANTNKNEFISGKSFSLFLEEPEASNFTVNELYVHSNDCSLENGTINNSWFLSERNSMPENCERGGVDAEITDNSTERGDKEVAEKLNALASVEQPDPRKDQDMLAKEISAEDNFLSEDDFICLRFESYSITGHGFLSDKDFGTTVEQLELDTLEPLSEENEGLAEEDLDFGEVKKSENFDVGYEPDDFDDEDRDIIKELPKLEEQGYSFQDIINSKPEESAKPNSQSSTTSDLEDSNMFDTLWEHQEFIEQLKMELKKVRATGLPTILEDSEFPRIIHDLKPWKIEEKFQHGCTINELPRFYKSYRERMRKLDILNFQKMYAIGSLQSKDPLQLFSSCKSFSPALTSFLPHSFRQFRRKKSECDPMKRFMRELYSDLEMVYVGQLCLSWEFLRWEYEKALELWESDPYGLPRYNEVAEEFQQFQVLLHRFIENERFQGPWVENYVRNRCVMRNLLQVPVIREDNTKHNKKFGKREADKDAITSDILVEIMEESIRTIWRFIIADKDTSSLIHKGPRETQVELQELADSELLVEIRADLQKKEKRLRELSRSGNSLLKLFQKHEEDGTDNFLYFFCEVDMKLVWRVLNMSRVTTDQLAWCRNKLNKINFVNRRIYVEPSFLLFPC